MIAARSTLFIFSFLGVLYALLSLINGSDTDFAVGMIVAVIGLHGWAVCDVIEHHR